MSKLLVKTQTAAVAIAMTIAGLLTTGTVATAAHAINAQAAFRDGEVPGSTVENGRLTPRPKPRPTVTPRPTGSPSATPTPVPSSPAPSAIACAFPTVTFNGEAYCPATIGGVQNSFFGTGTRVALRGVTVTTVTTNAVTVAAWATPPCPPGKYCGQLLTLQSLTVAWSGTSRPAYGDVLDLFGRTIPTSISRVGYAKTGWCPIEWC